MSEDFSQTPQQFRVFQSQAVILRITATFKTATTASSSLRRHRTHTHTHTAEYGNELSVICHIRNNVKQTLKTPTTAVAKMHPGNPRWWSYRRANCSQSESHQTEAETLYPCAPKHTTAYNAHMNINVKSFSSHKAHRYCKGKLMIVNIAVSHCQFAGPKQQIHLAYMDGTSQLSHIHSCD